MSLNVPGPVVSTHWLKSNLGSPQLIVLDGSLGISSEVQIVGARRFDIDRVFCDHTSELPHMMPTSPEFEQSARRLGLNNNSVIVVYDSQGIYSSPRVRWMLKSMGHDEVAVLDGGLPEWIKEGLPTERVQEWKGPAGNFEVEARAELFCNADFVQTALSKLDHVVFDARSAGRFYGREPEPRPGLRSGHMPGAKNLPFTSVLTEGRVKSIREIREILEGKAKADLRLIFSCGSGVTACISALAAELAGYKNISIYDGSWSEWGLPSDRPVSIRS